MIKADFASAVAPWGYGDVARVNEIIDTVGLEERAVADYVLEQCIEVGCDLDGLDPVALTYQFILDHATNKDREQFPEGPALEDDLRVSGNSIATSFDYTMGRREWILARLHELLSRGGKDASIRWMIEEIG